MSCFPFFRPESIDQHLNAVAGNNPYDDPHNMNSAEIPLDVDDLPPPPPEMIYLPPSSLKKPLCPTTPVRKPSNTKRISFDDDVQVINAGNISQKQLTSGQQLISGQAAAAESHYSGFPDNHERNIYSAAGNGQQLISGQQLTSGHLMENNQIYSYHARQPYNASPKKLFTEESNCQAAPPKTFLQDLQKVMSKKWQVAEKCRTDGTSVHHVYGFRYVCKESLLLINCFLVVQIFAVSWFKETCKMN